VPPSTRSWVQGAFGEVASAQVRAEPQPPSDAEACWKVSWITVFRPWCVSSASAVASQSPQEFVSVYGCR
jgi:hypothetical protein